MNAHLSPEQSALVSDLLLQIHAASGRRVVALLAPPDMPQDAMVRLSEVVSRILDNGPDALEAAERATQGFPLGVSPRHRYDSAGRRLSD